MKSRYIILISLILGLLTGYLIYDYLIKAERSMTNIQYGEVVVAAIDVAAKTQVTGEMLEVIKIPVEHIHPLAAKNKEEVTGRITTAPLFQGEQVLTKKIVAPGEVKNGLAYAVPPGKRAITVAVDEVSGISGFIKPGDRIDVTTVVNIPDTGTNRETPYSLVVLQNLQVLAAGRTLEDRTGGAGPADYKTVTLAVTVEESRRLLLADQKGSIRLMLRSPVDESTFHTTPFKAADFLR